MTEKKAPKSKIGIYLPDEIRHQVELLARYDKVSITEFVVKALEAYLKTRSEDIDFMEQTEEAINNRRNSRVEDTPENTTSTQF